MWQRRSLHGCADELQKVSRQFSSYYWEKQRALQRSGLEQAPQQISEKMAFLSADCEHLLRTVARKVRSESYAGHVDDRVGTVGALRTESPEKRPSFEIFLPYTILLERGVAVPLNLRDALSKIVYIDPASTYYFVGSRHRGERPHELRFTCDLHEQMWYAYISILDLVKTVKNLPDVKMTNTDSALVRQVADEEIQV